jgi:RNA polymerase sigma-70 factor (ECF subfamily)
MESVSANSTESFLRIRPRLVRIAYRMLGSVAEAEDVVQDAYVRWHRTDHAGIESHDAFLVRMVTRLCLDVLKSARVQREEYIGPWLPEPFIDAEENRSDDITLSLMIVLERLSPLERAAFLLHDVFGLDFNEVARAVGRDTPTCRKLASRAREHVQEARPRYPVPPELGKKLTAAFFAASQEGNLQALETLLAADVTLYSDGGGKRPAVIKPVYGAEKVSRFFMGLARKPDYLAGQLLAECVIDGLPGYVTLEKDDIVQTTALSIEAGRITGIYVVRNPDKLKHILSFI